MIILQPIDDVKSELSYLQISRFKKLSIAMCLYTYMLMSPVNGQVVQHVLCEVRNEHKLN